MATGPPKDPLLEGPSSLRNSTHSTRAGQVPWALTLNVNLEALMTSMMLKAAQLMSYPSICNC